MAEKKYVLLDEFLDGGLLQEVNRLFFHPRGLALELTVESGTQTKYIVGIQDWRKDPEGIAFKESLEQSAEAKQKANNVERMRKEQQAKRFKHFGWDIQPLT